MCGREGLFLPVLFSRSENIVTLLYLDLLSLTAHYNITQEQISSTCLLRKPNLISVRFGSWHSVITDLVLVLMAASNVRCLLVAVPHRWRCSKNNYEQDTVSLVFHRTIAKWLTHWTTKQSARIGSWQASVLETLSFLRDQVRVLWSQVRVHKNLNLRIRVHTVRVRVLCLIPEVMTWLALIVDFLTFTNLYNTIQETFG